MTIIGIINDPACGSDWTGSIKVLIEKRGFNVIFIGRDAEIRTDEMMGLLEIDGINIFQDGKPLRLNNSRPSNARGPRNRWGGLK